MPSQGVRRAIFGGYACPEARAFLDRTTNLGGKYRKAYVDLINGLVADGVWSRLDVLYIFATQDETNALLNLKSSSFAASKQNSPTFTVDQGFTGLASANNNIIVPSFTGYPQFVRNDCHVSVWEYSSRAGASLSLLQQNGFGWLYSRTAGDTFDAHIAETAGAMSVASTESRGHFMGHRTASTAEAAYRDGVEVATSAQASLALGAGTGTLPQSTATWTISIFSLGLSLPARQAALFNRLRIYMNAVGAP
jgi:hypothetical protein